MSGTDEQALYDALDGLDYPCGRHDIVRHATARGANDDVVGRLCTLPEGRYAGLSAVHEALRHELGA